MARYRNINPFSRQNNDTGYRSNGEHSGRFINKDGTYNITKEGIPMYGRMSMFHDLLYVSNFSFILIIVVFYLSINLCFTGIYYFIGADQMTGLTAGDNWHKFKELFYFSAETFTTVGYGRVNPVGDAGNIVAMMESLTGFLSLAIATGLIYGRFSRPRSYLSFSDHALISPYRTGSALMFRFGAYKDNHTLTEVEITVNTGLQVLEDGKPVYKYFTLELERSKVESMPLSWTVVHPITETSPFFGFTAEDMRTADVELYVNVRGFDDVFSNMVQKRTSYTYNEIVFNRKFVHMYREENNKTVLELHKLNQHNQVEI